MLFRTQSIPKIVLPRSDPRDVQRSGWSREVEVSTSIDRPLRPAEVLLGGGGGENVDAAVPRFRCRVLRFDKRNVGQKMRRAARHGIVQQRRNRNFRDWCCVRLRGFSAVVRPRPRAVGSDEVPRSFLMERRFVCPDSPRNRGFSKRKRPRAAARFSVTPLSVRTAGNDESASKTK